MKHQKLTEKDIELIDLAHSTTYKSEVRKLMQEADTEEARQIIESIMEDVEQLED